MAKPTLIQVSGAISDPMLSDNFSFEIPNVPKGAAGLSNALLFQCKSATKPGMTLENVEAALFGHTLEYAGRQTFGHDLSATYIENKTGQITKGLEDWSILCRNPDTQLGEYKNVYATNAYLKVYDQKGTEVMQYIIYGLWPSQIPDISFDGSSATLIEHQISFKYDHVTRKKS